MNTSKQFVWQGAYVSWWIAFTAIHLIDFIIALASGEDDWWVPLILALAFAVAMVLDIRKLRRMFAEERAAVRLIENYRANYTAKVQE